MSDRDLNYFSNMADRLFDEEIAQASSQPASIRLVKGRVHVSASQAQALVLNNFHSIVLASSVGQLERASLRREIVMEEFRRSAERHYDEL